MRNIAQSTLLAAGVLALLITSVTTSSGITNTVDVNTSWSFETDAMAQPYTNGQEIVDTAIDSWYGSEADSLLAKTNSYTAPSGGNPIPGAHSIVMELLSDASNLVESAASANVWIDHIVKPTRWDQEGHPTNNLPADAQMAYYVNTNDHIVIYHTAYDGGALSAQVWTEIPEPEIASNEWIRVSVNMDYNWASGMYPNEGFDSCYFRVKLNGVTLTNAAAKDGEYFPMATITGVDKMTSIQLQGTGMFDDFVVTSTEPSFSTSYTISATVPVGSEGGTLTPLGVVPVAEGGNQTFTVVTSNVYWTLTKLVVEEDGIITTNMPPIASYAFNNVTNDGSIQAYFEEAMTNGVPVEWMAEFDIEGQSPDDDPDNDGFTTAQEYLSSTHPTNGTSYLRILRSWQAGGTNYIEWESEGIDQDLPDFIVESTFDLTIGFAPTGTVSRGATNTWMQATPTNKMFYRIQANDVP